MLYATELMGAKTYDVQGNYVGKIREFFIEPADQPNRIAHYLLSRGSFQPLVARHDQVASVAPGNVRLNVNERSLEPYEPNEAWLAVQKDLLDQQIIDTSGRKVVRVNDVDLAEQRTNGSIELRVTQVDVGLPGAVRRLFQGIAPQKFIRKVQGQFPTRSIRCEPGRIGPTAPGETPHHPRKAGGPASCRSCGHRGRPFRRGAPGNHRVAR